MRSAWCISSCFFGRSLLALQKGWWSCNCTCEKFISVQRFSAVAGDTLIGRFWGGLFFFTFASLLFLGEVWNSPGTAQHAADLCQALHGHRSQPCVHLVWVEGCQNMFTASASPASGLCPGVQVVGILCSLWCCSKYLKGNSLSRTEMLFPAWCSLG